MKRLLWLAVALAALPACGNSYHPEYRPVTSVRYQETLSYPVPFRSCPQRVKALA